MTPRLAWLEESSGFSMMIAVVVLKLPPSNVFSFQFRLSIANRVVFHVDGHVLWDVNPIFFHLLYDGDTLCSQLTVQAVKLIPCLSLLFSMIKDLLRVWLNMIGSGYAQWCRHTRNMLQQLL